VANGSLHVNDASHVQTIIEAADDERINELVLSPAQALASLPEIRVDDATEFRVRNGRSLATSDVGQTLSEHVRVSTRTGDLLAVYRRTSDTLEPEVVLA
jgi:tRNA U55 pseudouridine synthase TruB